MVKGRCHLTSSVRNDILGRSWRAGGVGERVAEKLGEEISVTTVLLRNSDIIA